MINFNDTGTFEEWFGMAYHRVSGCYPSAKMPLRFYQDYLKDIENRSLHEIKGILRILLRGGTYESDEYQFEISPQLDRYCKENQGNGLNYCIDSDERFHRMLVGNDAWEGLTWGLVYLPIYPIKVIEIIRTFLISSIQLMPDDMIDGYDQAIEIIQKRFIDVTYPKEIFEAMKPSDFEQIVCKLYEKIGYQTEWTKATRDGGKDVIASRQQAYGDEHIYIECKKYHKSDLTIKEVQAFGYTLLNDKIHKGIIFCTGHIPKPLYEYDKRIEIIDFDKLIELLNSYWGNWNDEIGETIYSDQRLKERSL